MMKIDLYLSTGCASEKILRKNVTDALNAEGIEADVRCHRVNDEEAEKLGLRGSPTVLINGMDPFPNEASGSS